MGTQTRGFEPVLSLSVGESPTGSLQLGPIIRVLRLGTVVQSLGAAAGIGLDEVSSPGGDNPTFLTEPSREMAVVEVFGSDPQGPFPEHVLWEAAESLGVLGTTHAPSTSSFHWPNGTNISQRTSRNSSL